MTDAVQVSQEATTGHWIGGARESGGSRSGSVFDPALGVVTKQVALADRATTERAIAAAEQAFPAWRAMGPAKRARIMQAFQAQLEANRERIAELITAEHGKTFEDALGEVQRGIENVEFACSAPELLKGEYSKDVGAGIDAWSQFEPLGVVAGITPFNFPGMVPLWMYPAALVCGNTFVLKPSERDPSAAMFVAELMQAAGLPDGVLNVVNGDAEAVDTLLTDPRVKAVSFVGSTAVAEHIYATGTQHGKRVQALGGAKNHAVVMPDADPDQVVNALLGAAFGSAGERCMAISVVVAVGDAVADTLRSRLEGRLSELRVGPGMEQGVDMGPLVTDVHLKRVSGYVQAGLDEGAELAVDGRDPALVGNEQGFFIGPCLFDRVRPDMRIYQEEIFGPVLSMVRAASFEEALALTNAHEYGNGTCLFTADGATARRFVDEVNVGMVGVNVPLPVPVAYHSFGGFKRSLFGDLHAYGPDSIRFYTRRKAVTQRWLSSAEEEHPQFAFPTLE
jgi:malonate-semialdehyde dehydrogenase (acetylating)/methylmalonate-semialdehyde dehydrogenase